MKKVVIDAGHGINTAGKRTPDGIREWTLNSKVANYIQEFLKEYKVEIIRTDDITGTTDVPLQTRKNKTNSINPDAFVSIHHNALRGTWGNHSGVEVYTHTLGSKADKELAEIILPKLSSNTKLQARGVKKAFFYVLGCNANIPAVLVEGGFMDSLADYDIIVSEAGQKQYAKAVADALIEFLKLTKKQSSVDLPNSSENALKFKIRVNTPVLRVRKQPNTQSDIVGKVYSGEIYTIVETNNNWGRIENNYWICLDYTTRNIESSSYQLGRYIVTAPIGLNVRDNPNGKKIKAYKYKTVFDVFEVKGEWGRTPSGWVCLKYAKKL